jgi:DNA replication protein DnaC
MTEITIDGDIPITEGVCELCTDGIRIYPDGGAGICECQREVIIADLVKAIPKRFRDAMFAEGYLFLKGERTETEARAAEKAWLDKLAEYTCTGRAITYQGPEGTGKTTRAAALTRAYIETYWQGNPAVVFANEPEILKRTYPGNEEDYVDYLANIDLLVYDDFGKAKSTDYAEMVIYDIIDRRYRDKRPIIITTNVERPEIEERYPNAGAQMLSRLAEMNAVVVLTGKDFRRNNGSDDALPCYPGR